MPQTTANDFLPKDYTVPSTSKYMKFQDGTNVFRILAKPILGMEYWKTKADGTRYPVRKRMGVNIPMSDLELNPQTGKLDGAQHFWAMPVYNYQDKAIQILEIKQISVIKAIKSYIENPKWGNPTDYDISVSKSGSGLKTEYLVDHDPKEPVDPAIEKEFKEMYLNLEALFDGADPFAPDALEEEAKKMGTPAAEPSTKKED